MSPDGYILTNYHVINNADLVEVILADGRRFSEVQLVGFDTVTDLALLKVAGRIYQLSRLITTSNLRLAMWCWLLVTPLT